MLNNTITFRFNIVYLVIAILWPLIKTLFLGGIDGAGRLEMFFMIIAIIVNLKEFIKAPKTMLVWGIWIIYVIICASIKGFESEYKTFSNWIITCLCFPLITALVAYRAIMFNYSYTISILFYSYLIYVLIGAVSMNSFESYDGSFRMSNELGNTFFNTSILFASFVALFHSHKKINRFIYVILLILIVYIIFRSGERKGLISVFIIVLGSLFANQYGKGIKSLIYGFIVIIFSLLCIEFFLNNSIAGERLINSMAESEFQNNWFLKMMGDRGIMYYIGWNMFLNNFWTGIGITNFSWQNGYMFGLPFHTEYMVQLAECGIIGTLLFIIFNYGIIRRLFTCYRQKIYIKDTIIYISTFLSILIINLVTWTYDNPNYFMMYGVIYGFYDLNKTILK